MNPKRRPQRPRIGHNSVYEILQYIFNTHLNANYILNENHISQKQGRYGIIQPIVFVKNNNIYFNVICIDKSDIKKIMMDISQKYSITIYYRYNADWNFNGTDDERFGTKPFNDYIDYEEQWSKPDKWGNRHRLN